MSIPFDVVGDGEPLLLLAGQAIPGAALQVFKGARHAYFLERRAAASAAVLAQLVAYPSGSRGAWSKKPLRHAISSTW